MFVNYKNEKKTVADDWFFLLVFGHALHKRTELHVLCKRANFFAGNQTVFRKELVLR